MDERGRVKGVGVKALPLFVSDESGGAWSPEDSVHQTRGMGHGLGGGGTGNGERWQGKKRMLVDKKRK